MNDSHGDSCDRDHSSSDHSTGQVRRCDRCNAFMYSSIWKSKYCTICFLKVNYHNKKETPRNSPFGATDGVYDT